MSESNMQECAARCQPAVKRSDVSINQMLSMAKPHPGAAFRVSMIVYLHSLRSCSLIQINMKTYFFSLMWASMQTMLTVPTFENRRFQKCSLEWISLKHEHGKWSFSRCMTISQYSVTYNCSFSVVI